ETAPGDDAPPVVSPGDAPQDDASAAPPPVEPTLPQIPKTLAEESAGKIIREIELDGNARVAEDRILDYMRLKKGEPFSPTTLSRDVRELWASGLFEDIEVDLSPNDDGTVDLRVRVRERPNVRAVVFEGNKAFETEKLRDEIELKENTVFSDP